MSSTSTTPQISEYVEIRQDPNSYRYTYSADHPPVAYVKPGERVRIHCVDCFEDRLVDESMHYSQVCQYPYLNPQTGPVYVEGAEPGDTLLVHIHDMELTRDWAITGLVPRYGLMTGNDTTRMLTPDQPEIVRKVSIEGGRVWFDRERGLSHEVRPFMGTLGTAPPLEAINALTPSWYGGNMDCPEVCAGNTIHLPVSVPGGLMFCGDGHALQGRGEVGGVACETAVNLVCSYELLKGEAIRWPRITNDHEWMTIGSGRPMEDAVRIAVAEMAEWTASHLQMDVHETLVLLTQIIDLRIGNVCNPNYTVLCAIKKSDIGLST